MYFPSATRSQIFLYAAPEPNTAVPKDCRVWWANFWRKRERKTKESLVCSVVIVWGFFVGILGGFQSKEERSQNTKRRKRGTTTIIHLDRILYLRKDDTEKTEKYKALEVCLLRVPLALGFPATFFTAVKSWFIIPFAEEEWNTCIPLFVSLHTLPCGKNVNKKRIRK